ncbi:MAG: urease accessory protein UreD [Pseudomonadales bacterium]|nr:urease accessory protein UreD [Pseudomonadales bacterium]
MSAVKLSGQLSEDSSATSSEQDISEQDVWPAEISLVFEKNTTKTQLKQARHKGPLYVQKPFYPEGKDWAHVYLLHPPGGLVSGDSLKINVEAKANAGVLLTTPGAARVYRARDQAQLRLQQQYQRVDLTINSGATIEWFPLETIVFDGAAANIDTTIRLQENSHFIGWEITCFGLPASQQPFTKGSFRQRYRIEQSGMPLFIDQLVIGDGSSLMLESSVALAGNTVSGFLIAGPMDEKIDQAALFDQLHACTDLLDMQNCAAITLVGEFIIGRYLGHSAEQAKQIFIAWWGLLRPAVIQRKTCLPRIWAT